jgi:uncharacterized membrane-anchored protein
MKKIELKISGHVYNLEFEDDFFEYIEPDLINIHNSDKQIKVLLEILLSKSYENYKYGMELKKLHDKFDF